MCERPDEYQLGVTPDTRLEITKHMTQAEQFWHRARRLMYLTPDKFVGVNNITAFLMGMIDEQELGSRLFDSIDLNKDGSWRAHL